MKVSAAYINTSRVASWRGAAELSPPAPSPAHPAYQPGPRSSVPPHPPGNSRQNLEDPTRPKGSPFRAQLVDALPDTIK